MDSGDARSTGHPSVLCGGAAAAATRRAQPARGAGNAPWALCPPPGLPCSAVSSMLNERGSGMEDAYVLVDSLLAAHGPAMPHVQLMAVFDGHAGTAAASHAASRLPALAAQQLAGVLAAAGADAEAAMALLDSDAVGAALRACFVDADAEFTASSRAAGNAGGSHASCDAATVHAHAGSAGSSSGTTALAVLITPRTLWLAWAGALDTG